MTVLFATMLVCVCVCVRGWEFFSVGVRECVGVRVHVILSECGSGRGFVSCGFGCGVCRYVYLFPRLYLCGWVGGCVCVFACISMCSGMCVRARKFVFVYVYTFVSFCVCVCLCVCVCVCVCISVCVCPIVHV